MEIQMKIAIINIKKVGIVKIPSEQIVERIISLDLFKSDLKII